MKDRIDISLKYKRGPYTYLDLRIVEALGKYGPRNLNKIARDLGLPESTVRYRIKRLRKEGILKLSTSVYHTNIGLKKNVIFAHINTSLYKYMVDLFRRIDYWTYLRATHGESEGFHALYIAPVEYTNKVKEFIEEMRKLGIIEDYVYFNSTCLYGVSPKTKWYELKDDKWIFDWNYFINNIDNASTYLPFNLREPKEYPILADEFDIYILKELEIDPLITYGELAQKLNVTPQNIYYHYHKHVIGNRLIEGFEIYFRKFDPKKSFVFYFVLEFPNHDYLTKMANLLDDIPFAYSMGKVIGQEKLFVVMYVPSEEISNLFNTLNELVRVGILKGYEYRWSHATERGHRMTIAYKMFKDGKWLYPHEEYIQELHDLYRKIVIENNS